MSDTTLQDRHEFIAAGHDLAAYLTHVARDGSVGDLGAAVVGLTRDQLEAASMAFALLAAEGAPVAADGT